MLCEFPATERDWVSGLHHEGPFQHKRSRNAWKELFCLFHQQNFTSRQRSHVTADPEVRLEPGPVCSGQELTMNPLSCTWYRLQCCWSGRGAPTEPNNPLTVHSPKGVLLGLSVFTFGERVSCTSAMALSLSSLDHEKKATRSLLLLIF